MGRSKAKSSPAKAKASPIAVDTEAEHAAHVRDGIDVFLVESTGVLS